MDGRGFGGNSQNCGNRMGETPSTRVAQAPGGNSTFSVGWGDGGQQQRPNAGRQQPAPFNDADNSYGGDSMLARGPPGAQGGGGGYGAGGRYQGASSNAFASGSNQNSGNFISDHPSTRVAAPPGGQSSFSLGWGSDDVAHDNQNRGGKGRRGPGPPQDGGCGRSDPRSGGPCDDRRAPEAPRQEGSRQQDETCRPEDFRQPPDGFRQPDGYRQPQDDFRQSDGFRQPPDGFRQADAGRQQEGFQPDDRQPDGFRQADGFRQPEGGFRQPDGYARGADAYGQSNGPSGMRMDGRGGDYGRADEYARPDARPEMYADDRDPRGYGQDPGPQDLRGQPCSEQQARQAMTHGGRGNQTSSNAFASGSNQNSGNMISDTPSTRVMHAPGGASSMSLAWDTGGGAGGNRGNAGAQAHGRRQPNQEVDRVGSKGGGRGPIIDRNPEQQAFGQRTRDTSNAFATGSNQNAGNFISETSSTRINAPPGGASTFSLAWG